MLLWYFYMSLEGALHGLHRYNTKLVLNKQFDRKKKSIFALGHQNMDLEEN